MQMMKESTDLLFAPPVLTKVLYKCSDYYSPLEERSLLWNDSTVAIDWPLEPDSFPLLSSKDTVAPKLSDISDSDLPSYGKDH